ncbi:unnamed protein product [Caenorhabditis auriculariae]|uniref:Prolyl endopeptidase n=1 Tax=Caenorhabditis auriculariae TaxID=2777116 RepID=A0A8S1HB30_9PELO|nr:unnamed protein product [Caenorhabditis auriculariae]
MFVARNFSVLPRVYRLGFKPFTNGRFLSSVRNDLSFPKAIRDELKVDTYTPKKFEVKDAYQGLEDAYGSSTKEFIEKINSYSKAQFVDSESTLRAEKALREAWTFDLVGAASEQGGCYFYFKHNGVQNHAVYYKRDSNGDVPFLDVNKLAEDGSVSLYSYDWSDNSKDAILAYTLSNKGSDNMTLQFKKLNGEDLPDKVPNVKYSTISFLKRQGVFYSKYLGQNHALFYHELGSDPKKDVLVFERPDNELFLVNGSVSHCNNYLFVQSLRGCDIGNELHICKIGEKITPGMKMRPVLEGFNSKIQFAGNVGEKLFYLTNKDGAKFYKVVSGNAESPSQLEDVVPQRDGFVLRSVLVNKDGMILRYTTPSLETLVEFCDHDGKNSKTIYKGLDTLFESSHWFNSDVSYFNQVSFTTPTSVLKVTTSGEPSVEVISKSGNEIHDFSDRLEVRDGWANSKDGTKVHYFMLKPKKMRSKGPFPVHFYGYGGFEIPLFPYYSVTLPMMVTKYDAIFVLVNTRGGGEFGDEFYHDGRLLKKHNVFDDFLAVVKDFIDRGVTTPKLTAIEGGSNGGLLVAACARKAPELLGAVICHVGVLDMLRYPKFTIGSAWVPEYGNPEEEDHFKNLMSYSPYHNLSTADLKNFPNVLVLTADHDDRAVPCHSLKYLAELYHQAEKQGVKDKLFTGVITTGAGHGMGKPTNIVIRESAVVLSFIEKALGLKWKD